MRFYLDNAKDMAHAYHHLSQGFFQGFAKLAGTSESSRTLFCVSRRSIGVAAGVLNDLSNGGLHYDVCHLHVLLRRRTRHVPSQEHRSKLPPAVRRAFILSIETQIP